MWMNVQKRLLTLALLTSMTFGTAPASAQSSTEEDAAQDDASHSEAGSENEEASSSTDVYEDAEDPEIIEDIATVRVSARRIQPEFEADRSVTAIDWKELRHRQPASLGDALDEEPGAYMQATTRGSETVYVRGLVGPENLILVDGVRFNQSTFRTGPNQNLATLSPSVMARVELLRGPGSVLYGSGAMGGVIEVFPDAIPTDGGDVSVGLHARTADLTRGLNLRGGWGTERFGAMVGTTMLSHDTLNVGSRGGEDLFLAAEIDGEMLASDYEQRFLQTGVRVADASGKTELELRYLRGAIEGAKRTDQLGIGQMRDIDNTDDLAWLKVRRRALGPIAELNAFGAYHRTDEQTARVSCAFAEDTTPSTEMLQRCAAFDSSLIASRRNLRDTVQTFGGGLNAVAYPIDTLRIIVGAEGYMDSVASSREDAAGNSFDFVEAARGTFADGSTYTTIGAFAHAEHSLLATARHELMLSGGARVEHTRAFAPEVNATLGDVEFDNTGLVGQLGINYIIASRYNLYANWSQGFRSPNLQETTVLGDTGNFFE